MADPPATPPVLPALPPVDRRHLDALTDAVGIVHGARGARPDPATGHCTDDVARALQVDLLHERELGEDALAASITRNLDLLAASFDPHSGRFRHLRRRDGSWLDDAGTELAHGRTMLSLGEAMGAAASRSVRRTAAGLFERGLPAADDLLGLRARAAVVLGCEAAARAGWEGATRSTYRRFSEQLARQFEGLDDDWPWPRDTLGSESALPARALIVAGRRFASSPMVATGLRELDWLLGVQAGADAHLSLIGDRGWTRGAERPRYDQLPLEAASLLLAAEAAFFVTREPRYRASMEQAFAWFLGANDGGAPIAITARGSCHDGLGSTGPLPDQGAEATLMWHLALEHVRRLRRHAPAVSGPAPTGGRHAGRQAARRAVTGAIDG